MQSYIFHDSVELHFFLCVLGQSQLNTLLLSVDKHVRNWSTTRWAAAPSSCLKVAKNETSTRTLWAALAEELYQYRKGNETIKSSSEKKKLILLSSQRFKGVCAPHRSPAREAFHVNRTPVGSITAHNEIWQTPESCSDQEDLYIWDNDTWPWLCVCLDPRSAAK